MMENANDNAAVQRVELHLHTTFSEMDGLVDVCAAIKLASAWGHPAIAITDHGTAQAFPAAERLGQKLGIKIIYGVDACYVNDVDGLDTDKPLHITLLVRTRSGLKNLYRLISDSYLDFRNERPCCYKSRIRDNREGLLIGSAGENGEVFAALSGGNTERAEALAAFYDYLEIYPTDEEGKRGNLQIAALAGKLEKPLTAAGNVHILQPEDQLARQALLHAQGAEKDAAALYFRTTAEMLAVFSYLGKDCYDAVVTNPRMLAEQCESFELFEAECPCPTIENSAEDIQRICTEKLHELYGDRPHPLIRDRFDWELEHILKNGFDFEFMLAYQLIKRAKDQNRQRLTSGCVGASLIAYLLGITGVNPLPPHYRCPNCCHTAFSEEAHCGIDLPDACCPVCGARMEKEGFAIPAETLLAVNGDRQPIVDLDFPSGYQDAAYCHLKELFGSEQVLWGNDSELLDTFAAEEILSAYCALHRIELTQAERMRLTGLLEVVKQGDRHTQHFVILPEDREITDYCPVQRNSSFDRRPTAQLPTHQLQFYTARQYIGSSRELFMLQELERLSGVKAEDIPLDDPAVWQRIKDGNVEKFFEFGKWKQRGLIAICKPNCFADLVKLSGLSHGYGVWEDNAERLLKAGTVGLRQIISHRDDIYQYLLEKGLPQEKAFRLMEIVRKGRIESLDQKELHGLLEAYQVPKWYMESLKKIRYLASKANSAAQVLLAYRLTWYQVRFPADYAKIKEEWK